MRVCCLPVLSRLGCGRGRVPGSGAGHTAHRHAYQRQCRRSVGHLCGEGWHAREHCDAEVCPGRSTCECLAAGADLYLVDGLIGDAAAVIRSIVSESGGAVFNASTLLEPYRIEGKKTMGLEIVEQLGWHAPDVIVYPTGGGVGLIGIHKGLSELRTLGWLPDDGDLGWSQSSPPAARPSYGRSRRGSAGQSRGRMRNDRIRHYRPGSARRRADPGCPLCQRRTAVAVDDADILAELRRFARDEGLVLSPEGAACLAGVRRLVADGWLDGSDRWSSSIPAPD